MLRRPNVRARCYRLNVQIAHRANYRFGRMVRQMYFRQCRWCRRPVTHEYFQPRLCGDCCIYLHDLERDHDIDTRSSPFEGIELPKRILRLDHE